jgi:hypothetical protein
MNARFRLLKEKPALQFVAHPTRWYWQLYDRSGAVICKSRVYRTRAGCRRGLADTLRVWLPEAAGGPLQ